MTSDKNIDKDKNKEEGGKNPMWGQTTNAPLVHISQISQIIETVKIRCQKCGASIGANVIEEHVSSKRITCRECGWDNTKEYIRS